MPQDIIMEPEYQKLIEAVAKEIELGATRIKQAYTAEVLRTNWNIGRVITETAKLDSEAGLGKSDVVRTLSLAFKKPDSLFYDLIKFYKYYPVFPKTNLSWSHYRLLLQVDDSHKRRELEIKAQNERIGVKDLRAFIPAKNKIPFLGEEPAEGQKLKVIRGMLYYYRVMQESEQFEKERILVDVGFGFERDVRAPDFKFEPSGYMVHAVKEGEEYSARLAKTDVNRLYTYKAFVKQVVDGDTLNLRIDLGFRSHVTHKIRLRGIDAPEITTALGRKAKLFVQEYIDRNPWVVVKSYKDDKYGRYLVDVFVGPKEMNMDTIASEGGFLNQLLLDNNLAVLMG